MHVVHMALRPKAPSLVLVLMVPRPEAPSVVLWTLDDGHESQRAVSFYAAEAYPRIKPPNGPPQIWNAARSCSNNARKQIIDSH